VRLPLRDGERTDELEFGFRATRNPQRVLQPTQQLDVGLALGVLARHDFQAHPIVVARGHGALLCERARDAALQLDEIDGFGCAEVDRRRGATGLMQLDSGEYDDDLARVVDRRIGEVDAERSRQGARDITPATTCTETE
jgi:hypothetical protein